MISLSGIATGLFDQFGPLGLGIGALANTTGIPIPSEVVLPLGGLAVRTGQTNAALMFVMFVVAQMLGLVISFSLARFGGAGLIEKYGKYFLISRHELHKAERAFEKHGSLLVIVGLCLPAIHGYIGYPAGIARMNIARFLSFALAGVLIWTAALMYIGYMLGSQLEMIDRIFRQFSLVIVALLLGTVIWYIRHRRQTS